ncbi:MAG TPA: HlyD family type I secretion periplasmic adaptor subunit [Casimicrobiaceae bacterium]
MFGFVKPAGSDPRPPEPAHEFMPAFLRVQNAPPSPLPRLVLYVLLALLTGLMLWAVFGRLDIIATADGKLVPRSYLKIVQPAEGGVVREILVEEGQRVQPGQPLLRLDPSVAEADTRALQNELAMRRLQVRRIDAELADGLLRKLPEDPDDAYARAEAQFRANRQAYRDQVAQEMTTIKRTGQELRAALEVQTKLQRTVPIYQTMAERFDTLKREGFVSEMYQLERERDKIEKEQDLKAQEFTVESLRASLAQAEQRLAQVTSSYRAQLHGERAQADAQVKKLTEDLAKQRYRNTLVELRAPHGGVVKDLAAHTQGTVVSPGTVLLTLVPQGDELQAEVMVKNLDVGFVRPGQQAKVKLVAYPFQKYGLIAGTVTRVSADASETASGRAENVDAEGKSAVNATYRARIALPVQRLRLEDSELPFVSGMQVTAEIRLGERTVLEYLLAPVQKAWHEAARER